MSIKIALSTCPADKAEELAESLVREKLAACVNVIPSIRSIYWWNSKIEKEEEALLIIKTAAGAVSRLEQRLSELHPYDTPEFVVVSPEQVADKYAAWALQSVQP